MNLRRGYSDSRLVQHKPKIDEGGLDSFLPQFLLDDVDHHEEQQLKDDLHDDLKYSNFFDADEDTSHYQIFKQSAEAAVKFVFNLLARNGKSAQENENAEKQVPFERRLKAVRERNKEPTVF